MEKTSKLTNHAAILVLLLSGFQMTDCSSISQKADEAYYTESDFTKVDKIDIHCHINTQRPTFMEQAIADNFRILTINVDAYPVSIEKQQQMALFQQKAFPGQLQYLTTFSTEGWDNDNWQDETMAYLEKSFENGAIGVKVWKNIGMVDKDKNGDFIMIDHPKFEPIFSYLEEHNIPLCGHLGEPRNCWLPLDSMTVNNDRSYFKKHPEYHMYLHPEFPSYEAQIAARDKMLEKHPDMKFMGAHLASLEWSVDELAQHFDKYENARVDLAARVCHIQEQARHDWQKVHDFFVKYQDRIIYGTDSGDYDNTDADPDQLKKQMNEVWTRDWKFFVTNEVMTSWEVEGEFNGLRLPKTVIDKIYFKNATKLFPQFEARTLTDSGIAP